jgi:FAD/FMN-containing dehydrogenase
MAGKMSRRAFLGTSVLGSTLLTRCSWNPCPTTVPTPPLPACRGDYEFQNWAETISCKPASYCQPPTLEELIDLVNKAANAGHKVRTVGAGHSWSPLVLTNDVLVNLDRMDAVLNVDKPARRVTVQAGVRLKNLIPALRTQGLGLANLGSITEQSIAGATTTGTHGTGLPFGILATQIVGMKIVTGTGSVVTLGEKDPDLLAAQVSLGALGIVAEVTLQCVDDGQLDVSYYWCKFDDIVDHLDTLVHENQRVRLWWLVWSLGCREDVIVTTMNKPGAQRGFLDKYPEVERHLDAALAMETKALLKQRARKSEPSCFRFKSKKPIDYDKALTVPLLRVLHRECEYALELDKTAEALHACKAFFEERDVKLLMPVEVRFVKGDDALLSPAHKRDSGYIGVSVREDEHPLEVFTRFEPMMRVRGGRPHWGKVFNLTASQVKDLYPTSYDGFLKVRNTMDPKRLFANDQIGQLFG